MKSLYVSLGLGLLMGISGASLAAGGLDVPNKCSTVSRLALQACKTDAKKDYLIAKAKCVNSSDPSAKKECINGALEARRESRPECKAQFEAREKICNVLGQGAYDPVINPADFVDPTEIGISIAPNPYMPLIPGRTWVYKNSEEKISKTITRETKTILGVKCIVQRDIVVDNDGVVIEDTVDWYAQDKQGNVWYFGEIAKNFESGELVNLDGSWKAGAEGAKPGIVMFANPQLGKLYRQEFFLTEAEDMGKVINLTGSARVKAAQCTNDCLITADFTPIEPDVIEHKYYKPGVGFILEVKPKTGERLELVEVRDE